MPVMRGVYGKRSYKVNAVVHLIAIITKRWLIGIVRVFGYNCWSDL